eukprot:SM000062S19952  [mRNA]  locus=s62:643291:646410:+ [translate_table: standard]
MAFHAFRCFGLGSERQSKGRDLIVHLLMGAAGDGSTPGDQYEPVKGCTFSTRPGKAHTLDPAYPAPELDLDAGEQPLKVVNGTTDEHDEEFEVAMTKMSNLSSPCSWLTAPLRPVLNTLEWLRTLRAAFGPQFVAVVMIIYGVSQGYGESLQEISTNYYWKDIQQVEPASAQVYQALADLPWSVKPIYGLLSDTLPIGGYKRWPYLALAGLTGALCWWALVLIPCTPTMATTLLMGVSLSMAFPDVVVDAAIAQKSRQVPALAGDLQSLSWGSLAVGGLFGTAISGPAVSTFSPTGCFWLLSLAPLLVFTVAWALPEDRLPTHLRMFRPAKVVETGQLFWQTVRQRSFWMPALYMYLQKAMSPNITEALFYWCTSGADGPHFKEEFMGLVGMTAYIGMILGVVTYNQWFKLQPFRQISFWAQVLMTAGGMLDLIQVTRVNLRIGIPDKAFILGDAAIVDVFQRLQLMPMLVLAARLCPPGIEGTLFAFLMSLSNFGSLTARWLGAVLMTAVGVTKDHYDLLWLAVLIRTCMRLLPICVLFLLPPGDGSVELAPVFSRLPDDDQECDSQPAAFSKLELGHPGHDL